MATTHTLEIHGTVERLGPNYADGFVHATLSLSLTLTATGGPLDLAVAEAFVKPWRWEWTRLAVFAVGGTHPPSPVADAETVLRPQSGVTGARVDATNPHVGKLVEVIEDDYARLSADPRAAELLGKPTQANGTNLGGAPLAAARPLAPWRLTLARLWSSPQPAPQIINLTRFFRLPSATVTELLAAGRTGLVAAPIFVGAPFVAAGNTYEPERVTLEEDGRYRITYPAGPAPVVVAFTGATGLARPVDDARSLIKLSTLISADPSGRLRLTGDLGAHLTDLLAEVHNMPGLLLEWLEHVLESKNHADVLAVNASFRNAFIASLHDVAHTGVRPSATGEAPSALIAKQISRRLVEGTTDDPPPVPVALTTALEAFEAGLSRALWEELSAEVLVEQLSLLVPECPPKTPPQKCPTPASVVYPRLPDDASGETPKDYRERLAEFERTLHATYDGLRTTEALAALVERQWTMAVSAAANAELAEWWERARARGVAAAVLAELDLRRLLARSSSGPASLAFPRLSDSGGLSLDSRPSLEGLVFDVLRNYVTGRFDTPAGNPYETYRPGAARPGTMQNAGLDAFLRGRAAAFVRDQMVAAFAPDDLTAEELPTSHRAATLAETLTFLVGDTKANSREVAADAADPLRYISGGGVLLGRPGRPWRSLNFGLPVTAGGPLALGGAVNSVVTLGYRDGLLQSVIEYRNEPLLGTNPLADAYQNVELVPEGGATVLRPFITYECAYGTRALPTQPLFLDPLIYGEQYHAVVYLASTSGAFPASLVETVTETDASGAVRRVTLPWKFVLPAGNVGQVTFEPEAERTGESMKFVRRVPVSLTTTADNAGRAFPSPPKDVYPVARALDGSREEPLLLLVPSQPTPNGTEGPAEGWQGREFARHEMTLLPPSVDVKVWERWAAGDPTHPDWDAVFRRDVIAAHLQTVDLDPENNEEAVGDSRARIDDPAVQSLCVEAERLWPPPVNSARVTLFTREFPKPPENAPGLGRVRSPGIPIRVTAAGSSAVNNQTIRHDPPSDTDPAHKIRIPVGEVWRLHFRPVLFDGVGARFARTALKSAREPLKSLTMVAETAAPLRRAGEADPAGLIHGALNVTRDGSNAAALKVSLKGGDASRDLLTRIHRVEAYAQRWRWDGRPLVFDPEPGSSTGLAGFPFERWLADTDKGSGLEEFDGALFGDRSSEDALITNCQVEFVPASGVNPVAVQPLYEQRLGADAGALYFRFAARAYSRYEGLLTGSTVVDSREPAPTTNSEVMPERWVRHVVPCRHAGEVPRPRVKLLIPLYAAAPADPSPGLLVVLDEPAYADGLAGLAERIEAAVDTVTPPGADEPLAQLGPDPVIFATGGAVGAALLTDRPLLGPVGFTFDTDSSVPLFVKAAYFWRPPLVEGLPADLANHFVRLRLRRTLDPKGYEDPTRRPESLASEWSQGAWARVLAPADTFAAETLGTRELLTVSTRDLVYDRNQKSFARRGRRDELLDLLPAASDPGSRLKFSLFAVLTQSVPDALGRKDAMAATMFLPVSKITDSPEFMAAANVTVIEVMHDQTFELTAQNIVEALIPSQTPPDVVSPATDLWESGTPRAIIVRVAPAVPIV